MSGSERERWGKTRQRGKIFFILTRAGMGALTFAVVVFVDSSIFDRPLNPSSLLVRAGSFILAGFVLPGLWEWRSKEKRYAASEPTEPLNIGTLNGI